MAKKKVVKLSDNEKKAAASGMSVKAYNAAKSKSSSKSSSKDSSSKDEKKAISQTTEYYDTAEATKKEQAALDTARLQEDLQNIYKEVGIAQNRALQDYTTNIGNIEANKGADVASLNDYLTTNRGRTQEDLDTSLSKETRRFSLETDKVNQDLRDTGMTFSERTPEKQAQGGNLANVSDINMTAERNFQDIARYEAAKTVDIQNKYGPQTEEAATTKTRTLENIMNEQTKAIQSNARDVQDTASVLKETLSGLEYNKNDTISDISNAYDTQQAYLKNTNDVNAAKGN